MANANTPTFPPPLLRLRHSLVIRNWRRIHAGDLRGICDVWFSAVEMTVHRVSVCQRGAERWALLPDGSAWADEAAERAFSDDVCRAVARLDPGAFDAAVVIPLGKGRLS